MTTAVIVPVAQKFTCIINAAVFGTSRHIDYWEHHQKLGGLKKLTALGVTMFVHTNAAGAVTECIEAEALTKGKSYKTADRCKEPLTDVELKLIADAVLMANTPTVTPTAAQVAPTVTSAAPTTAATTPAEPSATASPLQGFIDKAAEPLSDVELQQLADARAAVPLKPFNTTDITDDVPKMQSNQRKELVMADAQGPSKGRRASKRK